MIDRSNLPIVGNVDAEERHAEVIAVVVEEAHEEP